MTRKLNWIVLISLLFLPPTLAQGTPKIEDLEVQQTFAAKRSEVSLTDTLPAILDGISIEAGQANGKATLNISRKAGNQSLVGTISAPLNKDSSPTELASLDGLAADFDVSLALSDFIFPSKAGTQESLKAAESVCKKYGADVDECDSTGIQRAVALSCGLDVPIKSIPEDQVQNKIAELLKSSTQIREDCYNGRNNPAQKEFLAASLGSVQSWAFTGRVGRKSATFFVADGTKDKQTNLPYSLSAAYGWIGSNTRYSLRGRYETRYMDGKTANRCQPFSGADGGSGLESCQQLPFGQPTRSQAFVLSTEGRWLFLRFAVSPIASYDFKERVLGIQLPVYLVRNSDGQLTGGFRLGWRNDTHDLTGSVFISKPLSVGD